MVKRINLRLKPEAAKKLQEIVDKTYRTYTSAIEFGIDLLWKQEIKKENEKIHS